MAKTESLASFKDMADQRSYVDWRVNHVLVLT